MPSAESELMTGDMSEGGAVCMLNVKGDHQGVQSSLQDSGGLRTKCMAVQVPAMAFTCINGAVLPYQTEYEKQDAETITDRGTETLLKLLVGCGESLTEAYQDVLDKQIQSEKQLQVKIKQLRQQNEEEIQRHKVYLKNIEDLVTKRRESKKKLEKEQREQAQKEEDLGAELLTLQSMNDRSVQVRDPTFIPNLTEL